MPRFFVSKDNISEGKITITDADAHHIARSLRMAEGDAITISDGEGTDYSCTLTKIRDDVCECEIVESATAKTESPIYITLFMAYPKGDKLEVIIQKAVELGASKIVPFESSRCIKRPKAEKAEKQTVRLARIAREAAKQCGRSRIPTVEEPVSFSEMLSLAKKSDLSLFCYENEDKRSLRDELSEREKPSSIAVIVGSEGGFSDEEARLITNEGVVPISLGTRILRCETAPSYVLASISYQYEL